MSSLRNNYATVGNSTKFVSTRPMSVDGTFEGDFNMTIDASGAPVEFWMSPVETDIIVVQQVNLLITDTGSPAITDYGNIAGGLTNGIVFFIEINGVRIEASLPFISNEDLTVRSRTFDILDFTGNRALVFRDLFNDYSDGVRLDGSKGDKFGLILNDDFSTLSAHRCFVKGAQQVNIVT